MGDWVFDGDCEGMVTREQIFPAILIVLSAAASGMYAAGGDWRKCVYWIAAAVLQAAVTF